MVNPTTVHQIKPSLDHMVYCANCGQPMGKTGQRYHCPNAGVYSGDHCLTKPVYLEHLRNAVVREMVNRLITEEGIQTITENIQETMSANAQIQRQRMEQAEATMADAKEKRANILQRVEQGDVTYRDIAPDIQTLDQTTAGLAFESMVARKELEKAIFVGDEEGIRDTVTNMDTWLGGDHADAMQELLDLLVRQVSVGSDYASIRYNAPMPAREHPEGVTEVLVELYPSTNA